MNHYQPPVRSRHKKYDRLCYIKRKHQLGITLSWSEIIEFIKLTYIKWSKKI